MGADWSSAFLFGSIVTRNETLSNSRLNLVSFELGFFVCSGYADETSFNIVKTRAEFYLLLRRYLYLNETDDWKIIYFRDELVEG